MKLPKILVLMSTYNGERFLKEQLDSIIGQKGVDLTLLIRDDGSEDATLKILEEYASRYNNIIVKHAANVGCKRSFYKLASYAAMEFPDYGYFAFSDQDDIWLEDKLSSCIDNMKEIKEDVPGLSVCMSQLVDENKNPLVLSPHPYNYSLGESLLVQPAIGCSMVFNRKLLQLFLLASPEDMFLHDEWIYKVCLACGGVVKVNRNRLMLYRQHGRNTIGGNQGFFKSWKRRLNMFLDGNCLRSTEAVKILSIYGDYIPRECCEIISLMAGYKGDWRTKSKLLVSKEIRTMRSSFNLGFKIAVLFNRF